MAVVYVVVRACRSQGNEYRPLIGIKASSSLTNEVKGRRAAQQGVSGGIDGIIDSEIPMVSIDKIYPQNDDEAHVKFYGSL